MNSAQAIDIRTIMTPQQLIEYDEIMALIASGTAAYVRKRRLEGTVRQKERRRLTALAKR